MTQGCHVGLVELGPNHRCESMKVSFSGHETFALRGAWLKKAVDAVAYDPEVFSSDEAIAVFGVGKNMVRAIKHWAVLCGVIEPTVGSRRGYQMSDLGDLVFGAGGWDPFFEDPATAWLMHWQIVKDVERATLWHFIFGVYRATNIEPVTLMPEIKHWLVQNSVKPPSDATLKRDLDCLVHTYAPSLSRKSIEDSLQSPLADLGVIVQKEGALYTSQRHNLELAHQVFAAIIIDYWNAKNPRGKTLSIDTVLKENGSPGKLLHLSEDLAYDLITSLHEDEDIPLLFEDTAGIKQLIRIPDESTFESITTRYFLQKKVESGIYA